MNVNNIDVREALDSFLIEVNIGDMKVMLEDSQVGELIEQLIKVREETKWRRNAWIAGTEWVAVA